MYVRVIHFDYVYTEIEKIISEIHTPEKLQKIKMRDLLEVWDRILKVISYRDIIVKDVEEELSTIELERLIAVSFDN